ncbi:hypothetical protein [Nesterenkonia halotolerans]|uniref:Uncharacterized protein n=1 Tax=Nesterenkonia halotolerans TaxID=225325 RepID=A0ABR9J5N8_9MICC|nr:hypothetical protein [Nesterenkonia halotolerans]MBE1514308.1 hypothetical protein [Nesterenkonia halotolerans]
MASETEQLGKEVRRKRAPVDIDHDKLARILMQNLDQTMEKRMNRMIDDSITRMDGVLRAQEERMATLGTTNLDRTLEALGKAEETASRVKTGMLWGGLGRLSMVLLPFALVLLALVAMVVPAAQLLGVAPLSEWIWGIFADIETLWGQAIFAACFLGAMTGVVWVMWALAMKIMAAHTVATRT